MDQIQFTCVISSTDFAVPLGMEIWLDDQRFFNLEHIDGDHAVEHSINDDDGEHELRFVLKNKLPNHTTVDAQGNILSDARAMIKNIKFDDIDCDFLVSTMAQYQHDFNGTGDLTQDRFYGELGCNGTMSLKFSTPIYLWLLENL
jgi:hypothetical protein